jgi:hypothetical protein
LQLGVLLLVLALVVQQQIQQLTRVGSCGWSVEFEGQHNRLKNLRAERRLDVWAAAVLQGRFVLFVRAGMMDG